MLNRIEINCACGSNDQNTKLLIRPLNPDVKNPVPLLELEISGNNKIYLDSQKAGELIEVLEKFKAA